MRVEAPFDQVKGSHRALPTQYGLTTSSSAQLASHSSQNSSPFLVSLPLLYDVENVVVVVDFGSLLVDFGSLLVGFGSLLVDFDSDTCPVLLYQANQAAAGRSDHQSCRSPHLDLDLGPHPGPRPGPRPGPYPGPCPGPVDVSFALFLFFHC